MEDAVDDEFIVSQTKEHHVRESFQRSLPVVFVDHRSTFRKLKHERLTCEHCCEKVLIQTFLLITVPLHGLDDIVRGLIAINDRQRHQRISLRTRRTISALV